MNDHAPSKETIKAPSLEDEIKQSLSEGKSGKKRKASFKKRFKITFWILSIIGSIFLYKWLFAYKKGGMGYGLCKVFLEQQVQYPLEMRLSYVKSLSRTMRIWYVQHDAFGQVRFDAMDCTFKKDPKQGMVLEKVTINRREMDPKIIQKFNTSIPAILAYPPDLTYPQGLPDNIKKLKLN